MPTGKAPPGREQGYTYLAILFFVVIVGLGLAVVGELWSTASQREKERDLLLAGRALREAIGRYHAAPAGGATRYPPGLEDLLKDNRVPGIRRHLRRIPVDPMTGKPDWATVAAPGGGIAGVHSVSENEPLKTANFEQGEESFGSAKKYSAWRFVYVPESTTTTPSRAPAR